MHVMKFGINIKKIGNLSSKSVEIIKPMICKSQYESQDYQQKTASFAKLVNDYIF